MTNPRPAAERERLVDLLLETADEHHRALIADDGRDPDWPIWYAEHLHERLSELLGTPFGRAQLVYCLMAAEFERRAREPGADWAPYYADHFLERYAPSCTPEQDRLALYYRPSCAFSRRVLRAIDRLGLDVERRDTSAQPAFEEQLVAARGRATVPVLHIDCDDGSERWMPESADIIRYLELNYGDQGA